QNPGEVEEEMMSERTRIWTAVVLFVWCLTDVGSRAQTQSVGVVRGRVVDASGTPVIRLKVTLGTLWGYSDATGRYLFSRVPFARYRVTLERDGRKVVLRQPLDVSKPITDVPDLKWP